DREDVRERDGRRSRGRVGQGEGDLGQADQGRQVVRTPGALAALVACALFAPGCGDDRGKPAPAPPADQAPPQHFLFTDVAQAAGRAGVMVAGRGGKDHLLEFAGGGCAWIDYDGDGLLDAFLVNGWRIEGDKVVEKGRHALYRNRGDGTFEDVTDRAGVAGD